MNPLERTRIDAQIAHHTPAIRRAVAAVGGSPEGTCVMLTEAPNGRVVIETVATGFAAKVLADLGRHDFAGRARETQGARLARAMEAQVVPPGHVLVVFNSRHDFGFVVTTLPRVAPVAS